MTTDHDCPSDTSRGSLATDVGVKNDAEKKVTYLTRFIPGEYEHTRPECITQDRNFD